MRAFTLFMFAGFVGSIGVMGCESELGLPAVVDEDVAFRWSCPGDWRCGPSGTNTNIVGGHDVSNVSMTWGAWATNGSGSLRMDSATIFHNGAQRSVTHWNVTKDGEIEVFYLAALGLSETKLSGTDVLNTTFEFTYAPEQGTAFTGHLIIENVACDPGNFDVNLTICRYEIVTDVVPYDTDLYPLGPGGGPYYRTCPNNDENGTLNGAEMYSLVVSKNAELDLSTVAGEVSLHQGQVIFGCLNGSVSKTQYYLNAFFDYAYDPHDRALADEQLTPMLRAWTAWHGGASTTQPGMPVCFDDPIGGLFHGADFCEYELSMSFEAAYNEDGAACANGDGPNGKGVHRRYSEPEDNVPGWDALPDCTAWDYYSKQTLDYVVGVYTYPGAE